MNKLVHLKKAKDYLTVSRYLINNFSPKKPKSLLSCQTRNLPNRASILLLDSQGWRSFHIP